MAARFDQHTRSSAQGILDLADRARFSAHMERVLAEHPGEECAALAIDIQHFRLYNIWYGKKAGDDLLARICHVLLTYRDNYGYAAGYLGDDDFLVFMPNNEAAIARLHAELQARIDVENLATRFYITMGVCTTDAAPAGTDPFTLYNYARVAVSQADSNVTLCYFNKEELQKLERLHRFVAEVKHALDEGEFTFYLQPKVNSMTHRLVGFEALARWRHPRQGILPPREFIDALEQNGLITQVDMHIWRSVFAMIARWKYEGRNLVPVSINVSRVDIDAINVACQLEDLSNMYGVEPSLVEVEITETVVSHDLERVKETMAQLHKAGFDVHMDDFGSGYSSLGMLKDLNVNAIKLDMEFLNFNQENYERGVQVIQTLVEMSHKLKLPVVVEGVRSQGQVAVLQAMDCFYMQGYYYYKALPVAQAEKLLEAPDTPAVWSVQHDFATRNVDVEGMHVDHSAAETLRAFRIYSDHLLFSALLNLETGILRQVRNSSHLAQSDLPREVPFSEFVEQVVKQGLVRFDDVPKLYEQTTLEALKEVFYNQSVPSPLGFRFRELMANGEYAWVTAEIIPTGECSPKNAWCAVSVREDAQADELARELEHSFSHDLQTGLFNRNRYEEDVVAFADAGYDSMAIVYVDAIGLHEINNHTGHLSGDIMLQSIADAAADQFEDGYVYRIGGDEFVVLSPNTSLEAMRKRLAKMREKLKEKGYEVSAGTAWTDDLSGLSDAILLAEGNMRLEKEHFYRSGGRARQLRKLNDKLESILLEKHDLDRFLEVYLPRLTGVHVVDLESDEVRDISETKLYGRIIDDADGVYSVAMRAYCDEAVAKDYRAGFLELLDYPSLTLRLRNEGEVVYPYVRADGRDFEVRVSPYSNEPSEASLTIWVFRERAR